MFRKRNNQNGNIFILMLFSLIVFLPLLSMAFDVGRVKTIKVIARHDLNLACRAASNQVDQAALADANNPHVVILSGSARTAYDQILQSNMHLDTSNNPVSGSPSNGPVNTVSFVVLNSPDLPYTNTFQGETETVTRPSVTATICFQVKLSGITGYATGMDHINLYVHSTVGPELSPQV